MIYHEISDLDVTNFYILITRLFWVDLPISTPRCPGLRLGELAQHSWGSVWATRVQDSLRQGVNMGQWWVLPLFILPGSLCCLFVCWGLYVTFQYVSVRFMFFVFFGGESGVSKSIYNNNNNHHLML
jgi:hypothetical protein